MKDLEKFRKIARTADGLVGCFSGYDFEESLELLGSLQKVQYEFFRKGDTIARAYWEDNGVGGCLSVYSKEEY